MTDWMIAYVDGGTSRQQKTYNNQTSCVLLASRTHAADVQFFDLFAHVNENNDEEDDDEDEEDFFAFCFHWFVMFQVCMAMSAAAAATYEPYHWMKEKDLLCQKVRPYSHDLSLSLSLSFSP